MQQISLLLKQQWARGVENSSRNQMIVPRRGSGVNSVLWNTMAGTWSNGVRHLRALLGDQTPVFKCMKMTAGDQAKWAAYARPDGEAIDPNVAVFCKLAQSEIYPWTCLDHPESAPHVLEVLTKVCEELKQPVEKWIGAPRDRTQDSRVFSDMICGCSVGSSVPKEMMDLLKSFGVFGSSLPVVK